MVVPLASCGVICAACWALLCNEGIEPSTLPTARPDAAVSPRRWDALARSSPMPSYCFNSTCHPASWIAAFSSRICLARSSTCACRAATLTVVTQRISFTP
jgi:hypothetical protein